MVKCMAKDCEKKHSYVDGATQVKLCASHARGAKGEWFGGKRTHGITIVKEGREYFFKLGNRKPGQPQGRWKS